MQRYDRDHVHEQVGRKVDQMPRTHHFDPDEAKRRRDELMQQLGIVFPDQTRQQAREELLKLAQDTISTAHKRVRRSIGNVKGVIGGIIGRINQRQLPPARS